MRVSRLALPLVAAIVAAFFVTGASGAPTRAAAPAASVAVADCVGPSAIDLLDSDPFWSWPCAAFLHVAIGPAGSSMGSVRSLPYYIDCPWACTRPFEPGSKVTLEATPSDGVTFTGWSGALCAGQGNPCVATVVGDETVTANFSGTVTPAVAPSAGTSQLHVFMGSDFADSVNGTGGFQCGPSVLNCFHDYTVGSTVTVDESGGACAYFTDTLAPGNHGDPYTFTMTGNRTVAPHQGC